MDFVLNRIVDPDRKEARQFILDNERSIYSDIEERVKELTKTVEKEIGGKISVHDNLEISGSTKLTEEKKIEIRNAFQEALQKYKPANLRSMTSIISKETENFEQEPFYIIIDKLDDSWADEGIRYKLIYALIETIKELRKIPNVKVIISLRSDLLERVIKRVEGPSFQEEKIKSLMLHLAWTKNQLIDLLNKRINFLIKDKYTNVEVTHSDIFAKTSKSFGNDPVSYMLDRTLMRPRDLITFFNICIGLANEKPQITQQLILDAEGIYSTERLTSLEQEWKYSYPNLSYFLQFFRNCSPSFNATSFDKSKVDEFVLNYHEVEHNESNDLDNLMRFYINESLSACNFCLRLFHILYKIGFIGLKPLRTDPLRYIGSIEPYIELNKLTEDSTASVHKMYWRTLGIYMKSNS